MRSDGDDLGGVHLVVFSRFHPDYRDRCCSPAEVAPECLLEASGLQPAIVRRRERRAAINEALEPGLTAGDAEYLPGVVVERRTVSCSTLHGPPSRPSVDICRHLADELTQQSVGAVERADDHAGSEHLAFLDHRRDHQRATLPAVLAVAVDDPNHRDHGTVRNGNDGNPGVDIAIYFDVHAFLPEEGLEFFSSGVAMRSSRASASRDRDLPAFDGIGVKVEPQILVSDALSRRSAIRGGMVVTFADVLPGRPSGSGFFRFFIAFEASPVSPSTRGRRRAAARRPRIGYIGDLAKPPAIKRTGIAPPLIGSSPLLTETTAQPGSFEFGDRAFMPITRAETPALIADRATWHVPDVETLFAQRKVSGTALLAAGLSARVNITRLLASIVEQSRERTFFGYSTSDIRSCRADDCFRLPDHATECVEVGG